MELKTSQIGRTLLHEVSIAIAAAMIVMLAIRVWAEDSTNPAATECVLEMTAPPQATIAIDGRNFGTQRRWTYRGLRPGRRYFSTVQVHFRDGGAAQRLVPIKAGTTVRRSVMAPSQIAFAFTRPGQASEVCTIAADGRGFRQLTHSEEEEGGPRLSPDGAKIAFARQSSDRKKTSTLYVINVEGSGERMLTEGSWPRWSPDGTMILFSRWAGAAVRPGENPQSRSLEDVWVINADGSNARRLTNGRLARWSPDSTKIVFTRGGALSGEPLIFVIDVDGGGLSELTRGSASVWSPDGSQIVYQRKIFKSDRETADEIYLMNADGGDVRRLTTGRNPVWAPKGRHVAFTDGEDVFVIGVDGAERRRLTQFEPHPDGWISGICWSPDGNDIAFAHEYGVDRFVDFPSSFYSIYRVQVSGSNLRRVVNRAGWSWAPDWR